ncbi:hypothetical protein ACWFPY_17880 [Nocardia fluminea]
MTNYTRWRLTRLVMALRGRREHRSDPGAFPVRREFGGWTIRPFHGWRSVPWVSPPLAYTREIAASDQDAAIEWALAQVRII